MRRSVGKGTEKEGGIEILEIIDGERIGRIC